VGSVQLPGAGAVVGGGVFELCLESVQLPGAGAVGGGGVCELELECVQFPEAGTQVFPGGQLERGKRA
jgi:hypothetical protein